MTQSSAAARSRAALLALALVVAACGGSDDNSGSSGSSGNAGGSQLRRRQGKKGGKLDSSAASDVDYLDPGHTYYTVGYKVDLRDPAGRSTRFKPDERRSRCRTSPTASRRSPTTQDRHGQDQAGVKFGPPVNREVDLEGRQVRLRALLLGQRRAASTARYFSSIEGAPKPTHGACRPISGITTPDDQTIVFKLTKARRRGVRRARWCMPITIAGARGVRGASSTARTRRRTTRTSSPPARTWSRTTRNGQAHRLQARQAIHLVRNPNWDKTTDFRPAYLDEIDIARAQRRPTVAAPAGARPART